MESYGIYGEGGLMRRAAAARANIEEMNSMRDRSDKIQADPSSLLS